MASNRIKRADALRAAYDICDTMRDFLGDVLATDEGIRHKKETKDIELHNKCNLFIDWYLQQPKTAKEVSNG